MIHVCSLARLHETVEATGARHVVTLLKDTDRVERLMPAQQCTTIGLARFQPRTKSINLATCSSQGMT